MNVSNEYIDQLLTSLKIIAMIKEGQKVCVRNGLLTLENNSTGVLAALRRWLYQDSRQCTLAYIRNTINNALDMRKLHTNMDSVNRITFGLEECLKGLEALLVTYDSDATISASIQIIQQRIRDDIGKCITYEQAQSQVVYNQEETDQYDQ